ncbi:MAG: response regulator [bacterium]
MAGDYGDLMAKLIEAFEGEAQERIQELNKATLALEQANDAGEMAELIKVIFREAHTLKGTAGGLGLKSIERLGHSMETVFGLLRSGEIGTSPEMFDVIYKSLDAIGELATSAARGQAESVDVGPLVESLNNIAAKTKDTDTKATEAVVKESVSPAEPAEESSKKQKKKPQPGKEKPAESVTEQVSSKPAEPVQTRSAPPRLLIPGKSEPKPTAELVSEETSPQTGSVDEPESEAPASPDLVALPEPKPTENPTVVAEKLQAASAATAEKPKKPAEVANKPSEAVVAPQAPAQPTARAPEESIRVSTSKLDVLMEQVAELQTARINAEQRLTEVREMLERVEAWDIEWRQIRSELWRMGLASGSSGSQAQPSGEMGKAQISGDVRSFQNLSFFLESNANHLRNSVGQLTGLVRNFDSDSRRMAQVMADLQDGVRRIRMLPISTVFETFPRLVRDTARSVNKEVNLIIKGGENEVDRTILEQVKAPLVHLLRNAVDHGLESTEKREAVGKPRQGRLELTAAQRGANLQVEVSEDGGGINVDKVRDSAVRKGLLSQEAAAAMSDQEAMWLIFRPGFSTKSEVTDLSGRGVGLDVVRENVEGLGGMIDVKSELGVGTTFTLTLPMSVATTLVMIVECGTRRFALPVTNILRIMKIRPSEIGQLRGRAAIDFEGRPIALTQLSSALGMGEAAADLREGKAVQALIVGSADKRYAFLVDGILGAQEVVVKSLLPPLDRVRRVAGATILGTGEVVMVVNVADLIRSSSVHNLAFTMSKSGAAATSSEIVRTAVKPSEPPLVLCVDDSFTTRTLVKSIVEAAGYRTKQAADGLEAWNILQSEPIQLVVTDVNMPRMDGFELTRTIRKNLQTKDLPVILVTSLDSPEERAEGVDAGADAHIVKGALRQEDLLETIKRLL